MVQIQNTEAITAIRDGAQLSISEGFPTQLSNTVIPVLDMTPHFHRFTDLFKNTLHTTTQTNAGLYTVPAGKKLHLYHVSLYGMINATSDNTNTVISITKSGVTSAILRIGRITLNAQEINNCVYFEKPIILNAGDSLLFTSAFTAGAQSIGINAFGFEESI